MSFSEISVSIYLNAVALMPTNYGDDLIIENRLFTLVKCRCRSTGADVERLTLTRSANRWCGVVQ